MRGGLAPTSGGGEAPSRGGGRGLPGGARRAGPVIGAVLLASGAMAGDPVACATTDQLDEKAICAWEDYRDEAMQMVRLINKALIYVDAYERAATPEDAGDGRDMLIASQEAWEVYRREACALESHLYFGGPGAGLAMGTCLYRITAARNHDLRVVLEEG